MKQKNNGLPNALRQMLSKNSNRFSEEEIEDLLEVANRLEEIELLKASDIGKDNCLKKKSAIKSEYVHLVYYSLKFLTDPDFVKMLHDLFNH